MTPRLLGGCRPPPARAHPSRPPPAGAKLGFRRDKGMGSGAAWAGVVRPASVISTAIFGYRV